MFTALRAGQSELDACTEHVMPQLASMLPEAYRGVYATPPGAEDGRPRDVARVAVDIAAAVDQHHVADPQGPRLRRPVREGRVGAEEDEGPTRRTEPTDSLMVRP